MPRQPSKAPGMRELAQAVGLMQEWTDAYGRPQTVTDDSLSAILDAMDLPHASAAQVRESLDFIAQQDHGRADWKLVRTGELVSVPASDASYELELEGGTKLAGMAQRAGDGRMQVRAPDTAGYHELRLGNERYVLACYPERCPLPSELGAGERSWGMSVQVYGLHEPGIWEGSYSTLAKFVQEAARVGADGVAISPVHAMFSAVPERYSPYSPSSRLFLNTGYIDPGAMMSAPALARAAGGVDLSAPHENHDAPIDWIQRLHDRYDRLRRLHDWFLEHAPPGLTQQYADYRERAGEALEDHARYEALHADYVRRLGPETGWEAWQADHRDPRSTAVARYAREHAREVDFHRFLQWLANEGLCRAHHQGKEAGMALGLIADLAIGTDPRGSHAWSRQQEILRGLTVGAPPDIYQADGQNWGLSAFSPHALQSRSYHAWIELLQAAFRYAGGVRIDHVLGLRRLWLVPPGLPASAGAYLRYPMDEMLALVALEAQRHHAIVLGENLGTVPEGFNAALEARGVLGMDVLWFQRAETSEQSDEPAAFVSPSMWSPASAAMTTTHDLPTLAGWWCERDLEWKETQQVLSGRELSEARQQRDQDKAALWQAFCKDRAAGRMPDANVDTAGCAKLPQEAPVSDLLEWVAGAACPLVLAPTEDLLGLADQPNLPGPTDQHPTHPHPNWRQRLPLSVSALFHDPGFCERVSILKKARSRP